MKEHKVIILIKIQGTTLSARRWLVGMGTERTYINYN